MTPPEIHVSVNNVRKQYGKFTALDGVSFEIPRGETFALLGPNGAGKSSMIEILEGYRDRTSGDALVLGVDPAHGGLDWKARLGIVLQSSGESGNITVREQVAHFAAFYPHPRDVEATLAAVGLTEHASTRIKALSGGQRRRVDVALGVIGRPELLFLDEPTTGFDPEARREFWDLILELKNEGTTIILTTHYLDEAAHLGDRAGIIAAGTLLTIGAMNEIGGADARVPIVRWRDANGPQEHRTTEPAELVARLYAQVGSEPEGLEIIRPSLEDIYLSLVGTHASAPTAAQSNDETPAQPATVQPQASTPTETSLV